VPTAIIAGAEDSLIVPPRTDALRASVGNLRFDRTIRGAGHNDVYHNPNFHQAMHDALETLIKVNR
jgi:pimeloyl-ACP methyl ester carboxylesterase